MINCFKSTKQGLAPRTYLSLPTLSQMRATTWLFILWFSILVCGYNNGTICDFKQNKWFPEILYAAAFLQRLQHSCFIHIQVTLRLSSKQSFTSQVYSASGFVLDMTAITDNDIWSHTQNIRLKQIKKTMCFKWCIVLLVSLQGH